MTSAEFPSKRKATVELAVFQQCSNRAAGFVRRLSKEVLRRYRSHAETRFLRIPVVRWSIQQHVGDARLTQIEIAR